MPDAFGFLFAPVNVKPHLPQVGQQVGILVGDCHVKLSPG